MADNGPSSVQAFTSSIQAVKPSIQAVEPSKNPTLEAGILPGRFPHAAKSHEDKKLSEQLRQQIDSYGSFEVMSSLTFGFAVNVLFENFENNSFADYYALECIFGALMAMVLVFSAYAMIVMSLTNFYVRRYLSVGYSQMAERYLELYSGYRRSARRSFYCGLVSFLIAVIIYLQPQLRIISNIIMSVILGLGTLWISFTTFTMLRPQQFTQLMDKMSSGTKATERDQNAANLSKFTPQLPSTI